MKLMTFMLILTLSLSVSCKKRLNLIIGTSTAIQAEKLIKTATPIQDPINSSIENATAYIEDGKLYIRFDYPDQTWFFPGREYLVPTQFLVRIFDKNGEVINYFLTRYKYFPENAFDETMKIADRIPNNFIWPKSKDGVKWLIKPEGNEFEFTLKQQVADYAETVEFGLYNERYAMTKGAIIKPYTKSLPIGKCVYDSKVYTMGAGVTTMGGYCRAKEQAGKYGKREEQLEKLGLVIEGDTISYQEPIMCGDNNIRNSANVCCVQHYSYSYSVDTSKPGSAFIKGEIDNDVLQTEETKFLISKLCACSDRSKLQYKQGHQYQELIRKLPEGDECLSENECIVEKKESYHGPVSLFKATYIIDKSYEEKMSDSSYLRDSEIVKREKGGACKCVSNFKEVKYDDSTKTVTCVD